MNTEQFIRDSAARGLSRRATRLALGIGPWVFREMLTLMPDIEWPAKGQSLDHKRANSQKPGLLHAGTRSAHWTRPARLAGQAYPHRARPDRNPRRVGRAAAEPCLGQHRPQAARRRHAA
ncbi:hypothetical protein ACPA9J_11100 [Pseudomonas aeruginosa]